MTMGRDHSSFHQAPNLSNQRNTVPFIIHCFRLGSFAICLAEDESGTFGR